MLSTPSIWSVNNKLFSFDPAATWPWHTLCWLECHSDNFSFYQKNRFFSLNRNCYRYRVFSCFFFIGWFNIQNCCTISQNILQHPILNTNSNEIVCTILVWDTRPLLYFLEKPKRGSIFFSKCGQRMNFQLTYCVTCFAEYSNKILCFSPWLFKIIIE